MVNWNMLDLYPGQQKSWTASVVKRCCVPTALLSGSLCCCQYSFKSGLTSLECENDQVKAGMVLRITMRIVNENLLTIPSNELGNGNAFSVDR